MHMHADDDACSDLALFRSCEMIKHWYVFFNVDVRIHNLDYLVMSVF